jgi:hypothetical protein
LIDGAYIASPEKAVLDELYLIIRGKRYVETNEWYLDDLNEETLKKYMESYVPAVKEKAAAMGLVRL